MIFTNTFFFLEIELSDQMDFHILKFYPSVYEIIYKNQKKINKDTENKMKNILFLLKICKKLQ
jgi:hypothetical protein